MKKIILSLPFFLALLLVNTTWAQNEVDVLRFSQNDFFGSARAEGMAGSIGGIGGDFSAVQVNPAGMARFSSSNFSISGHLNYALIEGVYNETTRQLASTSFKIPNVGLVLTTDVSLENNGRLYRQFFMGYTRVRDFNYTKRYEGQNYNSLLDVFANDGAGIPYDPDNDVFDIFYERPFTTGLGLDAQTIGYDPMTQTYFPYLTEGDMYHERTINTKGRVGDFHLGVSENYMNQIYYGGSVGIRRVTFTEETRHTETLLEPEGVDLRSFDYLYDLETKGWGINIKAGFLFLPDDNMRMGLSFESPTLHSLTDTYTANMTSYQSYGTIEIANKFVPSGEYKYRLLSPMKIRGSIGYIFNLQGAFNLDLEYVRFNKGKLLPDLSGDFDFYAFDIENETVGEIYRSVINTRIGMEYMIHKNTFIRAGYALHPQPFKKEYRNGLAMNQTLALGFGFERNDLFLDFSFRRLIRNSDYFAFDPSQAQNRTAFTSFLNYLVVSVNLRL